MLLKIIHIAPLVLLSFSELVIGQEFEKAATANGTLTCSTDTPSLVVKLDTLPKGSSCISPGAQCSLQCKQLPKCTSFNYRKKTRTCELFNFNPQVCAFEYGCTFYHVRYNGQLIILLILILLLLLILLLVVLLIFLRLHFTRFYSDNDAESIAVLDDTIL